MNEPDAKQPLWRALLRLDRAFWIASAVFTLNGAAYFGVLTLLTIFLGSAVGLSDERAGLTAAVFSASVTLANVLLGGITDALGARRAITWSALASLLGRALLAGAPSLPGAQGWAVLALVLLGVAQGVLIPACYAAVKQSTTARTAAVGFALLYAFQNVGALLQGFASPFVRARYGITMTVWLCAALTAVCVLVHVLGFPRGAHEGAPRSERGVLAVRDLFNPRFLYFIFILLGVRTLFAHQYLTLGVYVLRAYPPEVGDKVEWLLGINPFIVLVLTPVIAALTPRTHVVTMMILGTFVSAAATFLLVPGPSLPALVAYCVLFSVGEAIWSSRFLEYVAGVAPPDKLGVYMGFAQLPWFLAKLTTGWYSGAMLAWLCPEHGQQNTQLLWLVYALVGMTSPLGLLFARGWLRRGSLAATAA